MGIVYEFQSFMGIIYKILSQVKRTQFCIAVSHIELRSNIRHSM